MNLQNGYKVIYEKAADGKRTFYATKNVACDPAVDDKIVEATIGEYKLIYEKDGQLYGSTTGIPTAGDRCFTEADKVFKVAVKEPVTPAAEEPAQTYSRRARNSEPVVEEPVVEEPEVVDSNEIDE